MAAQAVARKNFFLKTRRSPLSVLSLPIYYTLLLLIANTFYPVLISHIDLFDDVFVHDLLTITLAPDVPFITRVLDIAP